MTREAKDRCAKQPVLLAGTQAAPVHGDALRLQPAPPRSKPPAESHRERGRGREREATVGAAAEEEQRGREEATIEHAFDSILIPAPSPSRARGALPPSEETRRCVAWGARRGGGEGGGTARHGESWKREGRRRGWPAVMALARLRPGPQGSTHGPSGARLPHLIWTVPCTIDGGRRGRETVRGVAPTSGKRA